MHKNLEDNYGAVISANHEALAQILEQVVCCLFVAKLFYNGGNVIYLSSFEDRQLKFSMKILKTFAYLVML